MKSLILIIAFILSSVAAVAADIASVNFKAIKDDLREYYFSKPENAEIKASFLSATEDEKKRMEDVQAAMTEGKGSVDLKKMMPKRGGVERYQLERKIDADLKKELYLIVTSLGLKYELIYDASDSETIIYAKSQVDDITTIVKQAIIELGRAK
jgi:muramoyltetrapeptide carboxypeptidase LdcA involved in peptidoglycan recycling